MHSQEVLQTDRQTRLPLVRQRWGLYESEVQKQPLIFPHEKWRRLDAAGLEQL